MKDVITSLLLLLPFAVYGQETGRFFSTLPDSTSKEKGNSLYNFRDSIFKQHTSSEDKVAVAWKNINELAVAGYYDEDLRLLSTMNDPTPPARLSLKGTKFIDARNFVLEKASKYRVVLINEGHSHPEHRLFTKSLLKDLSAKGFNVFMAEGIWLKNNIGSRGYPIKTEGFFLNEPNYGSLIRYAVKLGYNINGYEYSPAKVGWDDTIKLDNYGSIKYLDYNPRDSFVLIYDKNKELQMTIFTSVRERGQAENIVEVIKKNPTSKFIIHVGQGHLYESGPMMGAKLRELLNEDILTIDQVIMDNQVAVIDTLTNKTIHRPSAYLVYDTKSDTYYNYYKRFQVDYTIMNATFKDSLLRPGFLFKDIEKRTVTWIDKDKLKDCPCMFSAYYPKELQKEHENAIATDVIYVDHKEIRPLLLYKGTHTIIKKNARGEYSQFKLTIP